MFVHYVALGDSMSIDLYPALDAGETDVAVALERDPSAGQVAALGAASLFYRNAESHWPDEVGQDLVSRYPGIAFTNLATDAATIGDVFGGQLPELAVNDEPTLITLTVGTHDVLSPLANRPRGVLLERIVRDIANAYDALVDAIRATRPESLLLLTTVCDPSDRTGLIPGVLSEAGRLPLSALDALNAHIRELARTRESMAVADAYIHFLGHGTTAPEDERWYWRRSLLEPNARGANELRRVWLDAVHEAKRARQ
ncbi:MAG: GDSL-type esterase/lipase family protein [Gemmatimonadaceae bacterium]